MRRLLGSAKTPSRRFGRQEGVAGGWPVAVKLQLRAQLGFAKREQDLVDFKNIEAA